MFRAPWESVYSRPSVRSSRGPCSVAPARMFTARNSTAAAASPPSVRRVLFMGLLALLLLDDHARGEEEHTDERPEVDQVADVDHAFAEGLEPREEAEARH